MKKIISIEDNKPTYSNSNIDSLGRSLKCKVDSTGYIPPSVQIKRMMLQGNIDELLRLGYLNNPSSLSSDSDIDTEISVFSLKDYDNLERVNLIRERIDNYNSIISDLRSKYGLTDIGYSDISIEDKLSDSDDDDTDKKDSKKDNKKST